MILILFIASIPVIEGICVIDSCEDEFCIAETPLGIIALKKEPEYQEGYSFKCSTQNIEEY